MSEINTLFCEQKKRNEDESAYDKIGKMMEIIKGKNDIKKITEVANSIVNQKNRHQQK